MDHQRNEFPATRPPQSDPGTPSARSTSLDTSSAQQRPCSHDTRRVLHGRPVAEFPSARNATTTDSQLTSTVTSGCTAPTSTEKTDSRETEEIIKAYSDANEELQRKNCELQSKISEAETSLEQFKQQHESEMTSLRREVTSLRRQVENYKCDNSKLQQTISKLQRKSDESEAKHKRDIGKLVQQHTNAEKAMKEKIQEQDIRLTIFSRQLNSLERQKKWKSTGLVEGRKPVGLENLGNTCYLNSIMQNIYQTVLLQDNLDELNCLDRSLKGSGTTPLTTQLVVLLEDLPYASQPSRCFGLWQSDPVFDPSALFRELGVRSARFIGRRQQDSHEALRHLMEGVREEHKEKSDRQETENNTTDDSALDETRLTVVDRVFGGHFLSVFRCKNCDTPYHLFEPFLDVSLPILDIRATKTTKSKNADNTPGTPSPAERGTSNEKQQTTSNGGETEKNGNKERKQNETADRRCGTGSISDKEDDGEEDVNKPQMEVEYDIPKGQEDGEEDVNKPQMEVEYDIPKGQEDFDAKSNSQVQTSSGFTAETHRSAQIHQKPASSETLSENYNTTQCSTEDNGKLTAPPGNHDVCDNRQRSEDRSPDDLYKEAADKVKERLNSDGNKCANNSVVNYLRFYTREEELSEYFCLTCNEGKADVTLQRATRQTLFFNPPAVLTIQLKRFEQTSRGYVKVSAHVKFEEDINLSPYCSRFAWRQQPDNGEKSFQYRLYGVVVHSGSLEGGHYTACVRMRTVDVSRARMFLQKTFLDRQKMMTKEELVQVVANNLPRERVEAPGGLRRDDYTPDQWFEINDSSVSQTTINKVLNKQAYLLFYDRIA